MIIRNGDKWGIIAYTAEYKVKQYTNIKEGFPEDTIFIENKLTTEQQSRLDQLNSLESNLYISNEEATDFVFNSPTDEVDNRSDIEKVIERLIELDPEMIHDPMVQSKMYDFIEYKDQELERGLLVVYKNIVYKTIHPKRSFDKISPDQLVGITYTRIGALQDDGQIAVEPWSREKAIAWVYKIGSLALGDDGNVYQVVAGDGSGINSWPPTGPGAYGWKLYEGGE